jgi:hypothetical protein
VNSLGTLPDGRFRFECVLPAGKGEDGETLQSQKILLEARNEEIGREWMHSLTVERLSYSKAACQVLKDQVNDLEKETKAMEQRLKELHLVEKDLEGALQNAKVWKKRAEDMDQALYLLKKYLVATDHHGDDSENNHSSVENQENVHCGEQNNNNDASYLSSRSEEEISLDSVNLPGTHFSSLVNVCRGLRENLRLTSLETATVLEDLKASNHRVKQTEERLEKAEKYVCKLWEENCVARESLRRKKSEKKILVAEIRSLMNKSCSDDEKIAKLQELNKTLIKKLEKYENDSHVNACVDSQKAKHVQYHRLDSPEMKLLSDLEDQINTTLVQHEYLLCSDNEVLPSSIQYPTSEGTESITQTDDMSNATIKSVEAQSSVRKVDDVTAAKILDCNNGNANSMHMHNDDVTLSDQEVKCSTSPLRPTKLSLMDQLAFDEALSLTSANLEE